MRTRALIAALASLLIPMAASAAAAPSVDESNGEPRIRFTIANAVLEPDSRAQAAGHYTLRAALRADDNGPVLHTRYSAKALLSGDTATPCGPINDIFSNGFE